jgi:hypothetical protein
VTNADGTTSVVTLAQAGIQSIDLVADETRIQYQDGSSIDGQSSFTRTNGTTGKAAAVSFAHEGESHALQTTTTTNADGSTIIVDVARDADGHIDNTITTKTSADGLTRTTTFDEKGDGVADRVLTGVTIINADGSRTETLTNTNGGGILIDRTQTTTSADGRSASIARDTGTSTRPRAGCGRPTAALPSRFRNSTPTVRPSTKPRRA